MEIDWTFGISDFVKDQEEMLREFEEARTQAVLDGQLSLLTQLGKHLGKLVWKYLVYVSPDTV